jgi:Uma2 family endonuclease
VSERRVMNIIVKPDIVIDAGTVPWPDGEHRVFLHNISWEAYEKIGDALAECNQSSVRLTYDRGTLEIMTTSHGHDWWKKRLGRILEALAEEFDLPIETAGNMTFRHKATEQGIEADDCFWITHEPEMRGKIGWKADQDPPPDLFLEIEVSRGIVDRLQICANLGVPEIWTYDGEKIRVRLLQANKTYKESASSPTFPGISLAGIAPFLQPNKKRSYLETIRAFRQWVRKQRKKK